MPTLTVPWAPQGTGLEYRPIQSRIPDLLMRQGEIEAQRAQQSGMVWANLAQSLAQIGQSYLDPRRKAQAEEDRAQAAERAARTKQIQTETAAKQTEIERDKALSTAMTSGQSRDRVLSSLEGDPRRYEQALKHYQQIDDSRSRMFGDYAEAVRAYGDTPEAAAAAFSDLVDQGWDPKRLEPLKARLQNPESIKQLTTALLKASPDPRHQKLAEGAKLEKLNPGDVLVDPNTKQPVYTAPTSAKKPGLQHVETAQGIRAFDPETGTLGPVIAQGKAPAGDDKKTWIQRGNEVLRLTDDQIRPGDVPYSAPKQSLKNVIAGQAEELADFDTSLDDLTVIRGLLSKKGATGAGPQAKAMIPDWATSITGWGVDAKSTQATIDRVKQVIGKTLEGGVLRKEDELKYEKILPKIGDTPEVVQSKLNGLEQAIEKRKGRRLDALEDAGFDVTKYRQRGGKSQSFDSGNSYGYPEGTVIEGPDGEMVLRGGKWVKR